MHVGQIPPRKSLEASKQEKKTENVYCVHLGNWISLTQEDELN